MSVITTLIFDVLYALAVHRWFNRHEPSVSWNLLAILTVPLLPAWVLVNHAVTFQTAFLATYILFFTTLFTSIVVYRVSPFHPLAMYPGPILCKISQLWAVFIYSRGKAHLYRKLLHDKYGPIVRIGPNELSVTDKDMLPHILGSQGMPRGPSKDYKFERPPDSAHFAMKYFIWLVFEGRQMTQVSTKEMEHLNLVSTRDLQRHAVLRKVWNKAFSTAPLEDYEELMFLRVRQLIDSLKTICSENGGIACVDIATWIGHFTFDFMGDMAFGGGFELMRNGDSEQLLPSMARSLYWACLCQNVPWFAPVMRRLPYLGEPMRALGSFAFKRAKIRYDREPERKDLFHHLIAAYHADSQESPLPLIITNSLLAIIAGSDTTATVLQNTIFYLLTNQTCYARLRKEIDRAFPLTEASPLDTEILLSLPFLNAVINEVLRLQPPVSTTLQRAPAKGTGGKLMGTHYVKEGTHIQVPPYVLHRDPRYFFPRPEEFWPERWILDNPDSTNCAGKPLAMLELRVVISLFIMHFDMEFGDSFDPKTWTDSLRDYFVLETGRLIVKLRVRGREGVE